MIGVRKGERKMPRERIQTTIGKDKMTTGIAEIVLGTFRHEIDDVKITENKLSDMRARLPCLREITVIFRRDGKDKMTTGIAEIVLGTFRHER
jgi:hypothetical protein